jgi:DNA polymerase-3 subunit epsilon
MILFFDTETTGKCDFGAEPDAEHQPRLVQLGALLTDELGNELASVDLIIKPNGFEIPLAASSIHGITTGLALKCGVEELAALHVFDQLLMQSELAVAHNFDFDRVVMSRGSRIRADRLVRDNFCTMRAMTPICKIPNQYGYDDYKWPRLQEAYRHAFECDFDGAHDAMADVRACAEIFFWLRKQPVAA